MNTGASGENSHRSLDTILEAEGALPGDISMLDEHNEHLDGGATSAGLDWGAAAAAAE